MNEQERIDQIIERLEEARSLCEDSTFDHGLITGLDMAIIIIREYYPVESHE